MRGSRLAESAPNDFRSRPLEPDAGNADAGRCEPHGQFLSHAIPMHDFSFLPLMNTDFHGLRRIEIQSSVFHLC